MGTACIKTNVKEEADYSKSEYEWFDNTTELQDVNNQLKEIEKISTPLTYYGQPTGDSSLKIAYISDLHLNHHLKYYNDNERNMIKDITRKLFETKKNADIIVFCGDTSSSTKLNMKFYREFMRNYDYECFSIFRKIISKAKEDKIKLQEMEGLILEDKIKILEDKIIREKEKIAKDFDFSRFEIYYDAYCPNLDYNIAFEKYKKVKSYKSLNASDKVEKSIGNIVNLVSGKKQLETKRCKKEREINYKRILEIEERYGKPLDHIKVTDYRKEFYDSLKKRAAVYVVLGNHEYIEFDDVDTCVSYYELELKKIGIEILHNKSYVFDKYIVFGCTGFAKYEDKWNAETVPCCRNFNRNAEIKETELFEQEYENALNYAKNNNLCLLSFSHYPISSCLNNRCD